MNINRENELQETINNIMEDVILLEAMALRIEHRSPVADFSQEQLNQAFNRVLDYLSQHAFDLHILARNA